MEYQSASSITYIQKEMEFKLFDTGTSCYVLEPTFEGGYVYKIPFSDWKHKRLFKYVISCLQKLSFYESLHNLFPETAIVYGVIKGFKYKGYVIRQRKVDTFFNNKTPLDSFNWDELVDIEYRLWSYGFGLNVSAETYGPKNWGSVDGKVRLVDTSGITTDINKIKHILNTESFINKRVKQFRLHNKTPQLVDRYIEYIKGKINSKHLDRFWKINI